MYLETYYKSTALKKLWPIQPQPVNSNLDNSTHAERLLCVQLLFNTKGQLKQDDMLYFFLKGSQKECYTHTKWNAFAVNHLLQVPEQCNTQR